MDLHEFASVGGWATSGRDGRRLKLFHRRILSRDENSDTLAKKPGRLFSGGIYLTMAKSSPTYATNTAQPCHVHGTPQPHPEVFAGNQYRGERAGSGTGARSVSGSRADCNYDLIKHRSIYWVFRATLLGAMAKKRPKRHRRRPAANLEAT